MSPTTTTATRRVTTPAAHTVPDWSSAVCAQTDPDAFFPEGHNTAKAEENAKKVCGGCSIREACLQWAIETKQHAGVWGGLSEEDRANRRGLTKRGDRLDGLTAMDNILLNRLDEFRALDGSGLGELAMAHAMDTNVQTVRRVREHLAAQEVKAA